MRLSTKEVHAITNAFAVCIDAVPYTLYLFGSRADDTKKGGDIDLLVVVPLGAKENIVNLKNSIRSRIFEKIPEQKIDITVSTPEELSHDIFLASIQSECILLWEQLT